MFLMCSEQVPNLCVLPPTQVPIRYTRQRLTPQDRVQYREPEHSYEVEDARQDDAVIPL